MPWGIAVIIELAIFVCALWMISFLSTLVHELGHAVGCMFAAKDRHWHIRVGWGKRLLNTKPLTVNPMVFDGFFTPAKKMIGTKAKLIMTFLGDPVFSLLTVAGLWGLRYGGLSLQSDFFADGVIEFILNAALSINVFILVLSAEPIRCSHWKIKGPESDGLQIIHAARNQSQDTQEQKHDRNS